MLERKIALVSPQSRRSIVPIRQPAKHWSFWLPGWHDDGHHGTTRASCAHQKLNMPPAHDDRDLEDSDVEDYAARPRGHSAHSAHSPGGSGVARARGHSTHSTSSGIGSVLDAASDGAGRRRAASSSSLASMSRTRGRGQSHGHRHRDKKEKGRARTGTGSGRGKKSVDSSGGGRRRSETEGALEQLGSRLRSQSVSKGREAWRSLRSESVEQLESLKVESASMGRRTFKDARRLYREVVEEDARRQLAGTVKRLVSTSTERRLLGLFLAGCGLLVLERRRYVGGLMRRESAGPPLTCEHNYAVSAHVSEFWNTVSSASFLPVAVLGPSLLDMSVLRMEPNLLVLFAGALLAAAASALHHATRSAGAQALDEAALGLQLVFLILLARPLHKWEPSLREHLTSPYFFVGTTVGVAVLALFHPAVVHAGGLAWLPVGALTLADEYREASRRARRQLAPLLAVGAAAAAAAAAAWAADRFACQQAKRALRFDAQLHAWSHVFTALAYAAAIGVVVVLRADAQGAVLKVAPARASASPFGLPRLYVAD